MANRVTWSIENAGTVVAFDPGDPAAGRVKLAGMSGTGVAPTTVTVTGSAAGGGTWRRSARGVRQVTLPVATYGTSRDELDSRMRALVRQLDDTYTTPLLAATYPDGQVFDTPCHYSGGADWQWGSGDTDGRTYLRTVLQLTCPDPYFTSRRTTQFTAATSGAGRGLLSGGPLSELRLSGSQALGTFQVVNPGDVASWPVWTVTGPGTMFTARRAVDGAQFQLSGAVTAADPVVVDTRRKTVTGLNSGTNRYGLLTGAPRLWSLPPGASTVTVQLDGADASSSVRLAFAERRELVI